MNEELNKTIDFYRFLATVIYMEKMSITRALAEKKLLDKRIEKTISQAKFVTFAKSNSKDVEKNITKEDYCKDAKATLQSIKDLIDRKSKIDSAIAVSNATTNVEICGVTTTVAEAISRKNNIDFERALLNALKSQLAESKYRTDVRNQEVESKLQTLLVSMVGKENTKNMSDEAMKISAQYLSDNEFAIVDGVDAKKLVESLEKEIDEFLFNVDFCLSTSNTLSTIEI